MDRDQKSLEQLEKNVMALRNIADHVLAEISALKLSSVGKIQPIKQKRAVREASLTARILTGQRKPKVI